MVTPEPPVPRVSKWRSLLESTTTVVMLAAAALVVWRNLPVSMAEAPRMPRPPAEPMAIGSAAAWGGSTARVGILAFSDFECPFCAKAARETLRSLQATYGEAKLRIVFKHFPLAKHLHAKAAAAAAVCAGRQGKFWEMHDLLFAGQERIGEGDLVSRAEELNLDVHRFTACRDAPETAKVIEADLAEGKALGVSSTPTFFVGAFQGDGRLKATSVLIGARPTKEFGSTIDALLADTLAPEGGK